LDAVSIRTQINKKDLIVKEQSGKTFVHRLIAIEAACYRSPSLSVAFNKIVDELDRTNIRWKEILEELGQGKNLEKNPTQIIRKELGAAL